MVFLDFGVTDLFFCNVFRHNSKKVIFGQFFWGNTNLNEQLPLSFQADLYKLVRFAHNWNVGILEYWNHGFWDNGLVGLEN